MKSEKKYIKTVNKRFAKKQSVLSRVPAEIGNGYGSVEVENQQGYIYVTIAGKPEIVYNDRVPNQAGVSVWVGYAPEEPRKRQVLSTRSFSPTGVERGYLGYAPAKRYEWHAKNGGQDPLWVHQRALTFLRLSVSATVPETTEVYVNVFQGRIWSGAEWIAVPRQDVDIYEHIPTTEGKAAFVLFTIDTTGAVITTKGDEVNIEDLALSDVPAIPASTAFVNGAVRVYYRMTVAQEGRTNTDFVDLRWTGLSMLSLAVDWDAIVGKPTEFPPTPDSTYYPGRTVSASDPAANDDEADGYLVGWEWVNSTTGDIFFLSDATEGAAVWLKVSSGAGDSGWVIDGALAVSNPCDMPILITKDTEIVNLYVYIETLGASGNTVFDIVLNGGSSVLSSAATIAYNDSNHWVKVSLSTTSFVEGDVLTPKITGIAAGARGLRAILQTASSGAGGGSFNLTLTDGTTSVSNVGDIEVAGAIVSNEGGGAAKITHVSAPVCLLPFQYTAKSGTFVRLNDYLFYNTSNTNGDYLEFSISLKPGVYKFILVYSQGSNGGKLDLSVDGANIATGIDCYGSSADLQSVTSSVTVDGGFNVPIKITVNGKNASSSAYYSFWSSLLIIQTG